jgi:hypothetical protein
VAGAARAPVAAIAAVMMEVKETILNYECLIMRSEAFVGDIDVL